MQFPLETDRTTVFSTVQKNLEDQGFNITSSDKERPWGGFFVIDESQTEKFIHAYFSHLTLIDFSNFEKLSPKVLVVAPQQRLSWQYHHRREEIWKVVSGNAGIVISDTDEQTPLRHLPAGAVVHLKKGERHRLVGLENWSVIAEIWQHTEKDHPSDENDIVRLQDDFGR